MVAVKLCSMSALQRGRALVSAEMWVREADPFLYDIASTGPRFGKRGDDTGLCAVHDETGASTGPRFGKRGDPPPGHGARGAPDALQRGRALVSAEMWMERPPSRAPLGFNGAALW